MNVCVYSAFSHMCVTCILLMHVDVMCAVWAGQWQECVGDDFEQAQQMPIAQQGGDKVTADNAAMASYQFQIRARQRNASRWGARWLLGLGVGKTTAARQSLLSA